MSGDRCRIAQLADLARGGDQCAADDLYREFGLAVVGPAGQDYAQLRTDPPPSMHAGQSHYDPWWPDGRDPVLPVSNQYKTRTRKPRRTQ